MNNYQMTADSYKDFLERKKPTGETLESIKRTIAALEIMANTDRATQYELFNRGGFNDIVNGYIAMALDNSGIDDEKRADILQEVYYLFDTVTAEQAERYYMEH